MVLTEWLNTINSYKTNPSLALTILLSTHKHVFFYNVIWLQYVGFIQQIPNSYHRQFFELRCSVNLP